MYEHEISTKNLVEAAKNLALDSLRYLGNTGLDFGHGLVQGTLTPLMIPSYFRQRREVPEDPSFAHSYGRATGVIGSTVLIFCLPKVIEDPSDIYGIIATGNGVSLTYEGLRIMKDYFLSNLQFFPGEKLREKSRTNLEDKISE